MLLALGHYKKMIPVGAAPCGRPQGAAPTGVGILFFGIALPALFLYLHRVRRTQRVNQNNTPIIYPILELNRPVHQATIAAPDKKV